MKSRAFLIIAAALVLGGCVNSEAVTRSVENRSLSIATRNEPAQADGPVVMAPAYAVQSVEVTVPRSLSVSEANVYFPIADLVWRGEPLGDRHLQIERIYDEALFRATSGMTSGRPAAVQVEVTRFHGVTEKTRYTVGGVYSLRFTLTVRDPQTGAVIDGPRVVIADTKASGGSKALQEEQLGLTQRVVVVNRLTDVLRRELSLPVTSPLLLGDAAVPGDVALR